MSSAISSSYASSTYSNKTPVRSSINSNNQTSSNSNQILDNIPIDKSSDLVNIKNGYFSYKRSKAESKNNKSNNQTNNNSKIELNFSKN